MIRLRRISTFALLGFICASFVVWALKHRHALPVVGDGNSQGDRSLLPHGSHTHSPSVTGTVLGHDQRISGALVRAMTPPNTQVTTGSNGNFSLELPVDSTQLIRMTSPHAWTVQSTVVVGANNLLFEVVEDTNRAEGFATLGLTEDPTKGVILVRFEPLGRGYGATLNVAGGTRFVVTASRPRRQDTTTDADNELVIVNVPSGRVTVTPVPPHGTCTPTFGTATTRVDPQIMTSVSFTCT